MRHYVMALLSPSGRISRGALAVLGIPLLILTVAVRFQFEMKLNSGQLVEDWWYAVILALMWPQFCLVARALQNSEVPGVLALPVFALVAFDFLLLLDPTVLGASEEAFDGNYQILDSAITVSSYLARFAIIWGIINGDSDTVNAYGPPFGSESAAERERNHQRITRRVRKTHGVARAQDPLARMSALQRAGMAHADRGSGHDEGGGAKIGFNKPARRAGFGQR